MQQACRQFAELFPGRAFCVFVFAGEPGEKAHYAGNSDRQQIMKAVKEISDQGFPGFAPEDRNRN